MFKDDDEEEESSFGATRYACMPSLVALQQMRNRLHLAHLGRKLMKWTAMATGRELRKIAIELDAVIKGFGEEMKNAFILLARARYFCPELNKIVLENIGTAASVLVVPTPKTVSAVKMVHYEISETGVLPYEHLGLEKGGQAIMEAKKAWLDLLKKLIKIMQLRTSFIMVEHANKNATKKANVLTKIVGPRLNETSKYIISELEEMEREEVFRLKRVKQKKEFQKQLEELKRKGEVDEKGLPIKKDDQNPPTPAKLEAKSPGGSKTVVNRPPETVNLLILNPVDVAEPTSAGSTFISPFGGKMVPGITRVEELVDDIGSSVMASTLLSTTGESIDGKEDVIPKETNKKLNEPARNLLLEMTKGNIEDLEDSKNNVRMHFNTSEIQGNTSSVISSLSLNERTSMQASEDFKGYSADTEDSKSGTSHIDDNVHAIMPSLASMPINNVLDNVSEQQDLKSAPEVILLGIQSSSKSSAKTDRTYKDDTKNKDLYRSIKISDTVIPLSDVEHVLTEKGASDIKNRNTQGNNIQSTSDVMRNSDIEEEQNLSTSSKSIVLGVVKEILSSKENATKEMMKDATTMYQQSTSHIATQYEDIEEEYDLKRSSKIVIEYPSKKFTDSGINTQETVTDEAKEKENDDWEFVLANDKQGDDVDTKAIIIKDVDELSNTDSHNVSKLRLAKSDLSNRPLRIRDSLSETNLRTKNVTADDSREENESSKSEEGKTSKKKKKKKDKKKYNADDDLNKTDKGDMSYIN